MSPEFLSGFCHCYPNQGSPGFVVPGLVCIHCHKPLQTREDYFKALQATREKRRIFDAHRHRILKRAKSRPAEYPGRWVR